MANEIKVVIGSWGSYNDNNDRSLGSKWLTLNDYNDYSEIEAELISEGFELDGIDEELFIQDYEGLDGFNGDYMHPERLFEICRTAGILDDERLYQKAIALIEINGWEEFERRVEDKGDNWDDDIYFYKNMTPEEAMEEIIADTYPDLSFNKLGWISSYIDIDYAAMARDNDIYEASNGSIEIGY